MGVGSGAGVGEVVRLGDAEGVAVGPAVSEADPPGDGVAVCAGGSGSVALAAGDPLGEGVGDGGDPTQPLSARLATSTATSAVAGVLMSRYWLRRTLGEKGRRS